MERQEREYIKFAVYEIVRRIPYGRATSYGAVARAAGYPNMSRLVGKIMGETGSADVPAHRVVNSQGYLSGKDAFENEGGMQALLEAEGVAVRNDRIVNWRTVFWNPIEEIDIEGKE